MRLFLGGVALPRPHAALTDVVRHGALRYAPADGGLVFGSADPNMAPVDPARLSAGLDPSRRCDHGDWLYPGDIVRGTALPEQLDRVRRGVRRLRLEARVFGPGAGSVHVRLDGPQGAALVIGVPLDALRTRPVDLPIDPPLPPRASPVTLRLANEDARTFVLVTAAMLSDEQR